MTSLMVTALAIPVEKFIMVREYLNGYYRKSAFYLARLAVLLAFQCAYAVVFGSVLYYVVNLYYPARNLLIFLASLLMVSCICGAIGFMLGLAFPTPQAAATLVPAFVMPFTLFSGLFLPYQNVPVYFLPLWWISLFQYSLSTMAINEFGESVLDACTQQELDTPGLCPYGPCNGLNYTAALPCPGTVVLNRYQYDPADTARNFGILIAILAVVMMVGFWNLTRLLKAMR
jgi:ABC-type multidrug transport system permease subunit